MKRHSGKLRIIGGQYKGRNLLFPNSQNLRPTPERVRETLFNWLIDYVEGSWCLDLFAGSGALGLEAVSRGAKKVMLVESNRKTAEAIQHNIKKIGTSAAFVMHQNASSYLSKHDEKFNIVFLDPPFQTDLLQKTIDQIHQANILIIDGWLYLEKSIHSDPVNTPDNWNLYRSTKAGDVQACLYRVLEN